MQYFSENIHLISVCNYLIFQYLIFNVTESLVIIEIYLMSNRLKAYIASHCCTVFTLNCSRSLLMQSWGPYTEINEPSYKLSRSRLHFIYFKLLSFMIQVIIESLRRSRRYYPSEGNCIVTVLKYETQLMVWKNMFWDNTI